MQPWKKLFVFCNLREGPPTENVEASNPNLRKRGAKYVTFSIYRSRELK